MVVFYVELVFVQSLQRENINWTSSSVWPLTGCIRQRNFDNLL